MALLPLVPGDTSPGRFAQGAGWLCRALRLWVASRLRGFARAALCGVGAVCRGLVMCWPWVCCTRVAGRNRKEPLDASCCT